MPNATDGKINLGILGEYAPEPLLLAVIAEFSKMYPRIRFSIGYGEPKVLEEGLIAGHLSFALVEQLSAPDFCRFLECGAMPFDIVATREYAEAHAPLARAEQVLLAELIDLGEDLPHFRRWLSSGDASFLAVLQQVHPAFVVATVDAALRLMKSGRGIACLPRHLMKEELAKGEIQALCPDRPVPSLNLRLAYRQRSARSLVESLFLEFIQDRLPLFGRTESTKSSRSAS